MTVTVTVSINGIPVPLELNDQALAKIAAAVATDTTTTDTWPGWMNVETAARYLDVSPERVRKLVARRQIPYAQEAPGCRVFFARNELDHWMQIQSQTKETT